MWDGKSSESLRSEPLVYGWGLGSRLRRKLQIAIVAQPFGFSLVLLVDSGGGKIENLPQTRISISVELKRNLMLSLGITT